MRIVGGAAGGRVLLTLAGASTRPTTDRTREALFSTLATLLELDGAHVLDLYAGSGAVGLEALSRGAAHALLVESHRPAVTVLTGNIETLALPGARTWLDRVEALAGRTPQEVPTSAAPYDLVFADPPYALPAAELRTVLSGLQTHGWLAAGAVLAVERSGRDPEWLWPTPLSAIRERRYGEAQLWYGRAP